MEDHQILVRGPKVARLGWLKVSERVDLMKRITVISDRLKRYPAHQ